VGEDSERRKVFDYTATAPHSYTLQGFTTRAVGIEPRRFGEWPAPARSGYSDHMWSEVRALAEREEHFAPSFNGDNGKRWPMGLGDSGGWLRAAAPETFLRYMVELLGCKAKAAALVRCTNVSSGYPVFVLMAWTHDEFPEASK